jgi:EmrB/QacA subfamily drug resistance transporter
VDHDEGNADEATFAAPRRDAVLVAVLALGGLAFSVLQSMVAPVLPAIGHDLHASQTSLGWIVTGYLLAAAAATPIAGRMGDLWGRRKVLIAVLALLAVGCVISAVAQSLTVLVAGRVVQGGAGAVFPLAFGIIRDALPPHLVSTAIGMLSAILGVGGGAGIVLAGPIVSHLGWHWIFWISLIVTGVALAGAVALVPESARRDAGGLPLPAAFLLTGWLASLLLAVSNGAEWGWTRLPTLSLIGAAAVLAAAWIATETRERHPLVDLRLLIRRPIWTTDLSAVAFGFGMFGSFLLIPQLLELPSATGYGFGKSITTAGLFLLPGAVMMLIFGPVSGVMTRRLGARVPIVAGSMVCCLAFGLPAVDHARMWELLACGVGSGIGLGLAYAALPNAIIAHVRPEQVGIATGVNTLARSIGSSIGAAVVATILAAHAGPGGIPGNQGFTIGFAVCAVLFGLGGAAALLIPGAGGMGETEAAPRLQAAAIGNASAFPYEREECSVSDKRPGRSATG